MLGVARRGPSTTAVRLVIVSAKSLLPSLKLAALRREAG